MPDAVSFGPPTPTDPTDLRIRPLAHSPVSSASIHDCPCPTDPPAHILPKAAATAFWISCSYAKHVELMDVETVVSHVAGVPHTPPDKGRLLYHTVLDHGYGNCLELGFAHGVGSAYIAAALHELGRGQLTAVDNSSALERSPRAEQLLQPLRLNKYVHFVFHKESYTWHLMRHLEARLPPVDFCYLDGAHTWDVDGFAFFLVARILAPGGLIIFDDLDWSFASSPTLKDKPFVKEMSRERRETHQVRKVFDLLVRTDTRFDTVERDGWGFAHKVRD